jgi:hypothetical protein
MKDMRRMVELNELCNSKRGVARSSPLITHGSF